LYLGQATRSYALYPSQDGGWYGGYHRSTEPINRIKNMSKGSLLARSTIHPSSQNPGLLSDNHSLQKSIQTRLEALEKRCWAIMVGKM